MAFRRALLLAFLLPGAAMALDLHVSPKGDDKASGRAADPLASLEGARQAVRRLPRPLVEPVRVIFAAGTYRITQPSPSTRKIPAKPAGPSPTKPPRELRS